jgi:hypothetical protein
LAINEIYCKLKYQAVPGTMPSTAIGTSAFGASGQLRKYSSGKGMNLASGYDLVAVARELHNRGWAANHKRAARLRLMAEDNLLCLSKRQFVATTDSGYDLRVWLNR